MDIEGGQEVGRWRWPFWNALPNVSVVCYSCLLSYLSWKYFKSTVNIFLGRSLKN